MSGAVEPRRQALEGELAVAPLRAFGRGYHTHLGAQLLRDAGENGLWGDERVEVAQELDA